MKDPAKLSIWLGFLVLFLALVPWYFPKGSVNCIFGIPSWGFFIIVFLVVLVAYINFVISRKWDIEPFLGKGDK